MISKLSVLICLVVTTVNTALVNLNLRPTIGILTHDLLLPDQVTAINASSFLPASYVKYIESAGARVVPIFLNQDDDYYEDIASSVNGILFIGGAASITNTSGYGYAGQFMYDHAINAYEKGNPLPIWGTCLGFEMLTYLGAERQDWLTSCNAENKADPLDLQEGYMDSQIFTQMPSHVIDYLRFLNTTVNYHELCITTQNFSASGLSQHFKLLATSYDYEGLEYVALMEHNSMPIYGSQFHPEKNQFEWNTLEGHNAMPHDPFSIEVSQYFANFFIGQARLNMQKFATEDKEERALIYNYAPTYTLPIGVPFMQSYFFP